MKYLVLTLSFTFAIANQRSRDSEAVIGDASGKGADREEERMIKTITVRGIAR